MHFFFKTIQTLDEKGSMPFLWESPCLVARSSYRTRSYILLPSSIRFPSSAQAGSFHLLGEGREQSVFVSVSEPFFCVLSCAAAIRLVGSVPDEAGPRVAAGVAKVDDQGKVAVVDGDLGEANDASDALLFRCPSLVM